jgi:putative transposase
VTPIGWSMAYESLAAHDLGRKAQQDHGDEEAAQPRANCAQADGSRSAAAASPGNTEPPNDTSRSQTRRPTLTRHCGPGFAPTPRTTRGEGSGPPITTPAPKAGQSITRRSNAFGARKGYACRSVGPANASAHPPPEHTRECLGGMVERSITGEHLIAELDRLAAERGTYPSVLRCDNGPELACAAMADWAHGHVALHFIPPGEPWRNGYVESFNSRIRDECLNINSFWSLAQARVVIGDWKHDYNRHRRHSALGYQPPARYAATCSLRRTTLASSAPVHEVPVIRRCVVASINRSTVHELRFAHRGVAPAEHRTVRRLGSAACDDGLRVVNLAQIFREMLPLTGCR